MQKSKVDLQTNEVSKVPSGKLLHNELERFTMLLMGKSTSSMTMFNSYMLNYQRANYLVGGLEHVKKNIYWE
jgi:hypothetical protein